VFVGFPVIIPELLKLRANAQSENSEMYVFCLKMRLLMVCAGDAASFSSFKRVLTFRESV